MDVGGVAGYVFSKRDSRGNIQGQRAGLIDESNDQSAPGFKRPDARVFAQDQDVQDDSGQVVFELHKSPSHTAAEHSYFQDEYSEEYDIVGTSRGSWSKPRRLFEKYGALVLFLFLLFALILIASEDSMEEEMAQKAATKTKFPTQFPTFAPTIESKTPPTEEIDPKKKSTVVVFAGVYGTGQPSVQKTLNSNCGKCEQLEQFGKLGNFGGNLQARAAARAAALAELKDKARSGKTLVANLFHDEHDMVSFPPETLADSPKVASLAHPDLLDMARLAQEAGIDIHIVALAPERMLPTAQLWLRMERHMDPVSTLQSMDAQQHALFGQVLQLVKSLPKTSSVMSVDASTEMLDKILGPGFAQTLRDNLAAAATSELQDQQIRDDISIKFGQGALEFLVNSQKSWDALYETLRNGGAQQFYETNKNEKPTKVLFFAGLSFAGHDRWRPVLESLTANDTSVKRDCDVQALLFSRSDINMWNPLDFKTFQSARQQLGQKLEQHVNETSSSRRVVLTNLFHHCETGHSHHSKDMSYPNWGHAYENIFRPNLISLAAEVEAFGQVELQILLLLRATQDIVHLNIPQSDIGQPWETREIAILQSNALGLLAQLATLRRKFPCSRYKETSADSFANILEIDAQLVSDSLESTTAQSTDLSLPLHLVEIRKQATESLRQTIDYIEENYCS